MFLKTYSFVIAMMLYSVAQAQVAPYARYQVLKTSAGSFNLLDDVALNATASLRTITLDLQRKYTKIRVLVFFTHNAATTVVATPTDSTDGTNFASRTTRSCAGGACTVYTWVDTNFVSGNENFVLEYDVKGLDKLKIVFSGASGGASDLIDVQAVAIVGD